MKPNILMFLVLCCSLLSNTGTGQLPKTVIGVFDGRTPCQDIAKQIDEKVTDECTKIKWRLTLYKDSVSTNEGTYDLQGFVYKKDKPRSGKWHIIKGSKADNDAIIYRLELEGKDPLLLQKADDNILFFLDKEKAIMVGNRDFSYTLNRKK